MYFRLLNNNFTISNCKDLWCSRTPDLDFCCFSILSHILLPAKDDTFATQIMNKCNHQSKSVNNLKKLITEQKIEVSDNFHFTVLYKFILNTL